MWWFLFVFFILYSCVTSVLIYYALKRISNYESIIISIQQIIEYIDGRLKEIDSSGHFESDDEVGFFFEEIKSMKDMLNNIFEQPESVDIKESENG